MPSARPAASFPQAAFAADLDPRWAHVISRDADPPMSFVYGVKTTRVYTRPGATGRLPRPDNVVFFDSPQAAEAAGYRPRQRSPMSGSKVGAGTEDAIIRACRRIESAEQPPALVELAREAGMGSASQFQRRFKAEVGVSPKAYFEAHRARRLREALSSGALAPSVTQALYSAGFGSASRFYASADRLLGMPPARFRQGGVGEQIRFALGQCSLGAILVAESRRGLCAIAIGDQPEALLQGLQDQFPRAELQGGDADFELRVATVIGFVEQPRLACALPLDIRGTAFQERVWRALRELPAGSTLSYAELAKRIGAPGSARAVARACGANRLAVAIPCHRVVASDGRLSGYRWGVERKKTLLEREQAGSEPA